jgi:putative transposase
MNRDPFATNGIYHIYNRGTDKRAIYLDDNDRQRFIFNLYEFNDLNPAPNSFYKTQSYEVGPRKKVVEILAYCLMPNHYHLMLRQIEDGGVTLFMRKLGTGYTMYFNKKYERSGSLFQGKFKSVPVETDEQLRYLPHYIHANPIDPLMGDGIAQLSYSRWNSASAYLDHSHDHVAETEFLQSLYPEGYEVALRDWLRVKNLEALTGTLLD